MANQGVKYLNSNATVVAARGLAKYYGYIVTTVTATAALQIRDATAGAGGAIIDTIPTATAIGQSKLLPFPIQCTTGLVFDLNGGTGGIVLLYEGQV